MNGDAFYQLIDVNGKVILEGLISNQESTAAINLKTVPEAVYILKILDSSNKISYFRIIKI